MAFGFFRTFLLVFAAIALIVATFIYNTLPSSSRSGRGSPIAACDRCLAGANHAVVDSRVALHWHRRLRRRFGDRSATRRGPGEVVARCNRFRTSGGWADGYSGNRDLVAGCGCRRDGRGERLACDSCVEVKPLAALRDVAVDRSSNSRVRRWLGLVVLVVGLAIIASLLLGYHARSATHRGGRGLVFVGYLIFAPIAARPVGAILGAPIGWLRGVSGRMAARNAVRNPKRTANTSAALLVGFVSSRSSPSLQRRSRRRLTPALQARSTVNWSCPTRTSTGRDSARRCSGDCQGPRCRDSGVPWRVERSSPTTNSSMSRFPNHDSSASSLTFRPPGHRLRHRHLRELAVSRDTADQNNFAINTKVVVAFADGSLENMTVGSIYEGEGVCRQRDHLNVDLQQARSAVELQHRPHRRHTRRLSQ